MADVKAEIKGKILTITMEVKNPIKPSSSGKTLIVATTGGNKETSCKVKGKNLIVGCNAYIYPD